MNVFFFSSRRRHTRLTCDWSSDVCSSDLASSASMLCQAKAFLPVSMNQEGTAWRAFIASLRADRSRSSSQPSRTWLASPGIDLSFTLTESSEGTGPAQPFQAPCSLRPDAADRDAEFRVDFRVGMRRIADQHRQ